MRIGGIPQEGFTDYLTVVEIRKVTYLANATAGVVTYQKSGNKTLSQPTEDSVPVSPSSGLITGVHRHTLATNGIAHIAIRVNAALNCTTLPDYTLRRDTTEITHRQNVATLPDKYATLETRHKAYEYMTKYNPDERYYYPLYRAKNWTQGKELVARLDHGVKQVGVVKLLGYSLVNKRQVGIQHAHEMQADDYLILRIKEIEGHVISNNQFANGAFAILRAGDTSNTIVGAAEFSSYEPNGIVTVPIHASNSTIRNMTIEITDRRGRPAHFGRLHLWFKLLVTHG